MRHLATYMLLVLGGNASPTKEDVTAALSAVGVDVSCPFARDVLKRMLCLLWKNEFFNPPSAGGPRVSCVPEPSPTNWRAVLQRRLCNRAPSPAFPIDRTTAVCGREKLLTRVYS